MACTAVELFLEENMYVDLATKRFEAPAPKKHPLRPCSKCGGITSHDNTCLNSSTEEKKDSNEPK